MTSGSLAALVALGAFHGLTILRRAWLNMDRLWAAAPIGAGTTTLLTA
ncbi:hypothetical protein ACFQU9_25265 [Actinomadura namibiensis]|uniref:Uncharacterized protein n=1 Tax=Actinomadura namibiensis TaxID=182080 RepID=A0A7W3LSN1_ACTNM|nr:hypothetical protein [Actinomadura namibiensis]MBA8953583.1 hypothetical protein [Actinomadura namibiensis]